MNVPKALAAAGLFIGIVAPVLPDTMVGSPRSVAIAVGTALVAVAVYLGAAKPGEVANEPGS